MALIRGDLSGFIKIDGTEYLYNDTGRAESEHFVRGVYDSPNFGFLLPTSVEDGIIRNVAKSLARKGKICNTLIKQWKKNSR